PSCCCKKAYDKKSFARDCGLFVSMTNLNSVNENYKLIFYKSLFEITPLLCHITFLGMSNIITINKKGPLHTTKCFATLCKLTVPWKIQNYREKTIYTRTPYLIQKPLSELYGIQPKRIRPLDTTCRPL